MTKAFILLIFILCGLSPLDNRICASPNKSIDYMNLKKEIKITAIRYIFHDSSVPPPYHRSYTIDLNADSLSIVVDSYGDIIADKKYKITKEQFDGIIKSVSESKIKNCKQKEHEGCTGGTGESLTYFDGDEKLFLGYVYHCGGTDSGDMCGDIDNVARNITKLIPDFSELIK